MREIHFIAPGAEVVVDGHQAFPKLGESIGELKLRILFELTSNAICGTATFFES